MHRWEPASQVFTIVDLLGQRARHQATQTAYTFLVDGETEAISLTYGELEQRARAIAALLQSACNPGERVLLLYPPGLEYITAFFGCLYAGMVAIPVYPPRPNRSLDRIESIVTDAGANVALTTDAVFTSLTRQATLFLPLKPLKWLTTDAISLDQGQDYQTVTLAGSDLAFLQYTSGSTAQPKGVMVSHQNLLHNLEAIHHCFEHSPNSKGVIWLPPYHDMGLIGGVLQPLYGGFPVTLMPPLRFLQRPLRWLQAISQFRATTSGGPNFAYDLCVRKIKPEQLKTLDLSSWTVAFNGAEQIRAETLEQFAATFAPCGFRPEAFYPCYGLAEATLIVSGGLKQAPPIGKTVQRTALAQDQVIMAPDKDPEARSLVSCGPSVPDQKIVIVHPETLTPCPAGQVGEIWVCGPSIAQGYWQQSVATEQTFAASLVPTGEGPFLRTGDLGFMDAGELFVTGRLKDVMIVHGRNHYPQDLEATVAQSHPWIQPNAVAAFCVIQPNVEQVIVAAEVERRYITQCQQPEQVAAAIAQIRRAVTQHHDLQIEVILLLKPGTLPRTSSGKIQRYSCRADFLAGTLTEIARDPR